MNVNSMYQLMGAVQKNPQVVGEAVANGAGVAFEDMLQQASQKPAASQNKQPAANDKKPAETKDGKADSAKGQTNQQEQTNAEKPVVAEQDAQEKQQVLAAALVTSQPVQVMQILTPEQQTEAVSTGLAVNENLPLAADNTTPGAGNAAAALNLPQNEIQTTQTGPIVQTPTNQQQTEVLPQANLAAPTQTAEQPPEMLQNTAPQAEVQQAEQNMPKLTVAETKGNETANQQGQTEEGRDEAAAMQTPVFGSGNAVPVKVAENVAEQTLEPAADDAAEQLAQKINQALIQGESKITLNLNPANLGSLTVEIARMGDGTLTVLLSAVTEKAAGLLDKHSGSLQNLLAGNMPGTVRVEVENRTPDANQQQFLNPDQQQEQGRQESRQQHRQEDSQTDGQTQVDFMQQLRLGLIDLD